MKLRVSQNDINIFRNWLVKQSYLPQDVEDHYIASFITGAKGSIEKAKFTFDHFYLVQQTKPDLFCNYDPLSKEAERFNKIACVVDIPSKTPEEYTVCVSKLLTTDPTDYNNIDMFVRFFLLVQMHLWENRLGSGEYVFVMDATGLTFSHLKDITPMMAKSIVECIAFASPVRIKAIHLINIPPMLEWAVGLFKQLMPEKIKGRLHLHNGFDSLYDAIPREILPQEFGGDEVSMVKLYEKYRERLSFFREKCMKQQKLRQLEFVRRPKKLHYQQEMTGTFRKLNLD